MPPGPNIPYLIFGFLEDKTYYFNIGQDSPASLLADSSGEIKFNTGPTLTDQFTNYVLGVVGARYNVEFVDVWSLNSYQVGDMVEDWQSYAILD